MRGGWGGWSILERQRETQKKVLNLSSVSRSILRDCKRHVWRRRQLLNESRTPIQSVTTRRERPALLADLRLTTSVHSQSQEKVEREGLSFSIYINTHTHTLYTAKMIVISTKFDWIVDWNHTTAYYRDNLHVALNNSKGFIRFFCVCFVCFRELENVFYRLRSNARSFSPDFPF